MCYIYSHSQDICSTGEHNISSFRITKDLFVGFLIFFKKKTTKDKEMDYLQKMATVSLLTGKEIQLPNDSFE